MAAVSSGCERNTLKLRYCGKSREVKSSVRRDQKEIIIGLVRETEQKHFPRVADEWLVLGPHYTK